MESEEMAKRSKSFKSLIEKRRSIRDFSSEDVSLEAIKNAIMTACSAPSGANKQPWHFCLVSNPSMKSEIRKSAEAEEFKSYQKRMSDQWLKDLEPLGTDHNKPFLVEAPYLIVIFKKPYDIVDGKKIPNYYVNESVGIATGILIAALQNMGLATLTHTPSPMNFLQELLNRPENERAYLLLPVGYPKKNAEVPQIYRKQPTEVLTEYF
ncbi:nitroreductase family protein [Cryomorphaceae bacterium 1068]|nr:nitroreductase family protein [Cryomorphaceae bacterium 1068]